MHTIDAAACSLPCVKVGSPLAWRADVQEAQGTEQIAGGLHEEAERSMECQDVLRLHAGLN